jgi:alpha-mannosidase
METRQKIEQRIEFAEARFILPLLHPERRALSVSRWEVPGEPVTFAEATGQPQDFEPVEEGAAWGREWGTAWFRFSGQIPAEWAGKEVVALVDLSFEDEEGFGREGQVWQDGKPVIAVSRRRTAIPLANPAAGGETVDFYVEASANPAAEWHWDNGVRRDPDERLFRLREARLALADAEVFSFLIDFRVCREAMLELPADSARRARLERGLDQACRLMEAGSRDWIPAAKEKLAPLLACKNGDTVHRITATGHAHIDTAWCWPLRETIRKCARTFSTALAYMELYPDYHFSASQPVQYLWMKAHYPHIFEGIRRAVARGQWEVNGSMWVEPDCNVPSGESLVRQLVHGMEFFEREFGVTTRDLWLPDVFGYSAALPQILRKAGVDRFLTQKISWNDTNRFPHHTFFWEGIDGTRIFSHFPPVDTYNARVSAKELLRAEKQFAQKDRASRSLMPFGFGDGGGGPTMEMIERIRRCRDFEGLPSVEMGTVAEFFDAAEADIEDAPVWSGELYLELHRGTYTSQAHNKLMNRRCELLLRDAEFFDAVASLLLPDGGGDLLDADPAPERVIWDVDGHGPDKDGSWTAKALDRAWKLVLLNQFHDILPGSSIGRVYADSRRDYAVIEKIALAVREAGMRRLVAGSGGQEKDRGCTVLNTLAQARTEVVALPAGGLRRVTVPSCGYTVVSGDAVKDAPAGNEAVNLTEIASGWILANAHLRVQVTADGTLSSVRDLDADREVLSGLGNELHLLRDYPNRWNAWDIEASAMDDFEIVGGGTAVIRIGENGPLQAALEIVRTFGKSTVTQRLVLRAGSRRVDFETTVDWQERHRVLKVSFPLNIRTDHAVCEIQSGHVRRNTHRNTSWDAARFEISVHQWIDLTESGYGIALLNNGIFGCDVEHGRVRLTLLKAGSAPDPDADRGTHSRVFSLFPHPGPTQSGGVAAEAMALNVPLLAVPGVISGPESQSWLSFDHPGIRLDAFKRAEDGRGVVIRIHENDGGAVTAALSSTLKPGLTFTETNLREQPLPSGDGQSAVLLPGKIALRAFDLRTFRSAGLE